MFGIIRPCRHRLSAALRTSWWAHLCGLCYALRDEHGRLARRPVAATARLVASRWARQVGDSGPSVSIRVYWSTRSAGRAWWRLRRDPGDLLLVTEPTETATAEAVARTAVLAGVPSNPAPLRAIGRLFGRVVRLVDAVEDHARGGPPPVRRRGAGGAAWPGPWSGEPHQGWCAGGV